MNKRALKGAVFLDRDGTINVDTGYIGRPDGLTLIPGAARAIRQLNSEGVRVIVVSNQSGVARGFFGQDDVRAVNARLSVLLNESGAKVNAYYFCPHHPEDGCECRKPAQGLLKAAAREHGIDLKASYVIGDKASDVELARGAGARSVLVKTGMGHDELKRLASPPDFIARDLAGAVAWVLSDMKGNP